MPSYQRTALYIFFDAIEKDLVQHLRQAISAEELELLSDEERAKAKHNLSRQIASSYALDDDFDLIFGLDLMEKYQVLMRHRPVFHQAMGDYFEKTQKKFEKLIPIRNATMHGRPLTTIEFSLAFNIAESFLNRPDIWLNLKRNFDAYNDDPASFSHLAVSLVDSNSESGTLHNLPVPEHNDTGFVRRTTIEKDLKKKILGRHPVVTVLGAGGDGKTALMLQTAYGLVESQDHDFDAIIWVSAKTTQLTTTEIKRIENSIKNSLDLFAEIAEFEPSDEEPLERVRKLLAENKILLIIDNLETIIDERIKKFTEDVPGQSKVVFTSRVPIGSDVTVKVKEFSNTEARSFLSRLIDAHSIDRLRNASEAKIEQYLKRLKNKPILIKWFALGVASGIDPDQLVRNPELPLEFCFENIVNQVQPRARTVLGVMTALPHGCSAVVLQEIGNMNALEVESALSELSRFELVGFERTRSDEPIYAVSPLIRTYLTRINTKVVNKTKNSEVIKKYNRLISEHERERAFGIGEPYRRHSFSVRNKSESISARKLRDAMKLAERGEFEKAIRIISEVGINHGQYFEKYRVEAYVNELMGQVGAAHDCYESAIELNPNAPQVRLFFGRLLRDMFQEHDLAAKQFEKAHELDPKNFVIVYDWARTKLFSMDLIDAQKIVDDARSNISQTDQKKFDQYIDLQAQIFVRSADEAWHKGDMIRTSEMLGKLRKFMFDISESNISHHCVRHIMKVSAICTNLSRIEHISSRQDFQDFCDWFDQFQNLFLPPETY